MSSKLFQLVILLTVVAFVANACKYGQDSCKKDRDCCYGRCLKVLPFTKGICNGPRFRHLGKRSIINDDDDQDINIEDDLNDDAPDAEESFEGIRPGLCTPIGARCPPRGRGVCCSGRCRRTGIGGRICVRRYV